jgi:hypothetical protein
MAGAASSRGARLIGDALDAEDEDSPVLSSECGFF